MGDVVSGILNTSALVSLLLFDETDVVNVVAEPRLRTGCHTSINGIDLLFTLIQVSLLVCYFVSLQLLRLYKIVVGKFLMCLVVCVFYIVVAVCCLTVRLYC